MPPYFFRHAVAGHVSEGTAGLLPTPGTHLETTRAIVLRERGLMAREIGLEASS